MLPLKMRSLFIPALVFLTLWNTAINPVKAGSGASQRKVFQTNDGVQLVGDLYIPANKPKSPVVLLLHMLGHSRADYSRLITPLLSQGFAVVSVDLRGHGESVMRSDKSRINFQQFTAMDWAKLPTDLAQIVRDLQGIPGIDGSRIAIVGASIGGNAAAIMGATDSRVKAEVLLSPGMDYHKLAPLQWMKSGQRPTWLIAGKGDDYSAKSVQTMEQLDPVHFKSALMDSRDHGTDLLNTYPELNTKIASYLKGQIP